MCISLLGIIVTQNIDCINRGHKYFPKSILYTRYISKDGILIRHFRFKAFTQGVTLKHSTARDIISRWDVVSVYHWATAADCQ
jgi:hypothetical protein